MATQTTYELSQDRQVLQARLVAHFRDRKQDYEHAVSYDELSELVGGNVSKDTNLSSKLTAAMRAVSRDLGIHLVRDPNTHSVRLLAPGQRDGYAETKTSRLRRAAKRNARDFNRIAQFSDTPEDHRAALLAHASLSGAIAAFSGSKSVERVQEGINDNTPMSLGKTLDTFKKHG